MVQTIREFVARNYLFGREAGLADEESFLEAGIIDSTGVLELVSFLEERFGIRVENEDLIPDNLDSISKVVRYIGIKLAEGAPAASEVSEGVK